VTLSEAAGPGGFNLKYDFVDSTAHGGTDFAAILGGILHFNAGDTVGYIEVNALKDGVIDDGEVYNVVLHDPSVPGWNIVDNSGIVAIEDVAPIHVPDVKELHLSFPTGEPVNDGTGNHELDGDGGNNLINGNGGDDTLHGKAGNDILNGGDGNDKLSGNDGNDILNGGNDNDSLNGGKNSDELHGDAGNDTLVGSTGNDTLDGGSGADKMSGNDGDDFFKNVDSDDLSSGSIDGGKGDDLVDLHNIAVFGPADTANIHNVEILSLEGAGNSAVTLDYDSVIGSTDANEKLFVFGDAGDSLNLSNAGPGPDWTKTDSGHPGDDGRTYDVYQAGTVTVLVDTDVTTNIVA
jgi:Ca2+-binding RTX toxin-like protein